MAYEAKWANEPAKLNNIEVIKLKRDGLDIIPLILNKYSKEGINSITEEDKKLLKWAGIEEHRPKDGHFALGVRVTSGILTSEQVRTLADIATDYGRGKASITTRGSVRYRWIRIENLPDIFDRLKAVELSSFEACGDCPRTIIGNPLAGIDKDELIDTSSIINELNGFFHLNRDFSNLPRKFKISVSSSIYNSANAEINDLAFSPAVKLIDGVNVIGFHLWVGGGLSAKPHIAKQLDVFVKPEEVIKVAAGVATIFRDFGYRENRFNARLKFLVADWGADKFKEELIKIIGDMPSKGEDKIIDWNAAYFYGVHEQKQQGKNYIGINIPFGNLNDDELRELARISDEYGDGKIRTAITQNIIISGVSSEDVEEVLKEDIFKRLSPYPKVFTGYTVACAGKEFCNLAIVETKQRAKYIAEYLDENLNIDSPIRIHFTGCPNSCGHKHIADICLQGALIKTESGMVEAFDIFAGGQLGKEVKFVFPLNIRVKADEAHFTLEKLINYYANNCKDNESFNEFINRSEISKIKEACMQQ